MVHNSTHRKQTTIMSILDSFNLGDIFGALADEDITAGSTTAVMQLGKRVPYAASINGTKVNAYVTLQEANLTRLSLLEQEQITSKRKYYLATGIMKPVKFDIELMIDGQMMNLIDLLCHVTNKVSNNEMSHDEFIMAARRIGINFTDGMPLFFQQFGASEDGFRKAIDAFKSAGARDARVAMSNPGRILVAYSHDKGVPVTSFELGSVDRTKSPRYDAFPDVPQGFINLVDAQIEQFTRILKLRKSAHTILREIETQKGWSQEKIKKAQEKADLDLKMSKQWVASWSGAQRRIEKTPTNQFNLSDMYDPANAPCGRFTMVVNNEPVEIDLWTNSARANETVSISPAEPF